MHEPTAAATSPAATAGISSRRRRPGLLRAKVARLRGEIERYRDLAGRDPLTDLPNRAALRTALDAALERTRSANTGFALLFMDLDLFKEVNDTLGHEAGDRLLIALARRLERVVRESDTVARLGGDEFAVILAGTDDETQARAIAQEIAALIEEPFILDGHAITIGVSIGISVHPAHGAHTATELMRLADVAMFVAKRGHLRVAVYDYAFDGSAEAPSFSRLGELRTALERGELTLYYQPWLSPRLGGVEAVEALVRWNHPSEGLLSPAAFLPLAEQSGFIRDVDLFVLDAVCAQAAAWRAAGLALRIAFNVSRASLLDEEFSYAVAGALIRHGLEGPEIELEVTENGVMGDPDLAAFLAERLAALGIRLAIDDFGTGYSSLAQFRRLRPSTLKIDQSFVGPMLTSDDDMAIVESTIALGHRLGSEIVAEGVEDEGTLARLIELEADYIQGYVFARPMPTEAVPGFIESLGSERVA